MEYAKCSKCGNDEFVRVVAIPKIGQFPTVEERYLICQKCKTKINAQEINEQLK